MHPNHTLALQWFAAFNEHHLENLLSLYNNTEHYSPKLKQRTIKSYFKCKLHDSFKEKYKA